MIFLDFEYNRTNQSHVNPVCCVTHDSLTGKTVEWWLHNNPLEQKRLATYLTLCCLEQGQAINAYAAVAEFRAMISLGLDPLKFKAYDQFLEYKCLTNHNDNLMYGKQLVDGKVKMTFRPKPKWQRTEEDTQSSFKPTHSLAEATYKLTGVVRDTEHKNVMRDLIISDPESFTEEEQDAILKYCREDVEYMPRMWKRMLEEYATLLPKQELPKLDGEMLLRGKYSAITAIRESRGYGIDYDKTRNFALSVPLILFDCQRDINDQFPDYRPFQFHKKDCSYSWNQKATREWIEKNCDVDSWTKTDTGKLSLSLDAFQKFFDYKHTYPRGSFGAQMVRYLKLKQSLNGFSPTATKSFWSYVGPDKMVRPYMGIYGAQSSRSQPSATGFMFLKPAWMRALVVPPKGKAYCGVDYGSQEFFISALCSRDKNMINAYLSGDVYFFFAKEAGAVPKDAKRSDYEDVRDLFKATVLGLSYLMSSYGLANKLSLDTGRPWSEGEAQEMIDKFYDVFDRLGDFQQQILDDYCDTGYIKLPCGWYMFGQNDNHRSIANVPVQGFGGSILRKADEFCFDRGLYVPITLHDALYIEYDSDDLAAIDKQIDAMREAFIYYFPEDQKEIARKIKMDAFAWSPDYPAPKMEIHNGKEVEVYHTLITPAGNKVKCSNLYIDKRAKDEYAKFSKYFVKNETGL